MSNDPRVDDAKPGDRVLVTSRKQLMHRVGTLARYEDSRQGDGNTRRVAVVDLDAAGRAAARTVRVIAVRKAD